jgi:hypothetical protein
VTAAADLDANATGRVVPVGQFDGAFGALEYFYALAGPLEQDPPVSAVRVTDASFRCCHA